LKDRIPVFVDLGSLRAALMISDMNALIARMTMRRVSMFVPFFELFAADQRAGRASSFPTLTTDSADGFIESIVLTAGGLARQRATNRHGMVVARGDAAGQPAPAEDVISAK
jgi:hypothetical protein